jgi:leucyl aminopeptidase
VLDPEEGKRVLLKAGRVIEAVNWTRAFNTRPGNLATPNALAEEARGLAKAYPNLLHVEVLGQEEIEKERMGGVLAVSAGSENPPRFIVLEYAPQNASRTVALVGKAVTFDSGGISLKPGKDMDKMKYDKSGGVAVLGLIRALCEIKLPVRVIGIIPAVENMPSGRAARPGDVITLRAGRTVEVVNTDAEGRLILADGLDYALSKSPDLIVDIATLTGACVVALGHLASGLLGTADQGTIEAFFRSGERTGERVWQLPLWDEYAEALKTPYADFKNVGDGAAGTITAAAFLKPYVKNVPWVHLDIAGTAWNDKEGGFLPVGPTGTPVRLLLSFLEEVA